MAQGNEHMIGGVAIWLITAYILRNSITSISVLSLYLVCAIAGSLFPDIDVKSKGQKFFYGLMAPVYIFLFLQRQYALCFLVGICAILPVMSRHRGLFHCWWFVASFACIWGLSFIRIFPFYTDNISVATIFFILGSFSHLWLDFGFIRMFVR